MSHYHDHPGHILDVYWELSWLIRQSQDTGDPKFADQADDLMIAAYRHRIITPEELADHLQPANLAPPTPRS